MENYELASPSIIIINERNAFYDGRMPHHFCMICVLYLNSEPFLNTFEQLVYVWMGWPSN